MLKFLRHDTHVVATIFGQIQYPSTQICMFRKKDTGDLDFIAHGSLRSLDLNICYEEKD